MAEDKIKIYGELESGVPGGVVMSLKKSVTYEELLELRNSSRLQPGMQYRIIDYVTVGPDFNSNYYKSAGNMFDVVVTADSSSTLKEDAEVMHREGDTYFNNCKLAEWKIKYCLDNDMYRFETLYSENGKGVIYWMRDENGNECPYDFKNIKIRREFLLQGLLFENKMPLGEYCYTFQHGANVDVDASLNIACRCRNNIIRNEISYGGFITIVFNGIVVENNLIEDGSSFIYAEGNTAYNLFGKNCRGNYIEYSSYNIFKNNSENINVGKYSDYNVFGRNAAGIILEDYCSRNHFDDFSGEITLGKYSCDNYFGPSVQGVKPFQKKENSSTHRFFIEYFCNNHFEGGVLNWNPFIEHMPTSDSKLQNLYVHSGDYYNKIILSFGVFL